MNTRYPILDRLPPDEAAVIEAQSDAGLPLTDEQVQRLGICTKNIMLLPVDGSFTNAQITAAFPNAQAVLKDIVKSGLRKVQDEQKHNHAAVLYPGA